MRYTAALFVIYCIVIPANSSNDFSAVDGALDSNDVDMDGRNLQMQILQADQVRDDPGEILKAEKVEGNVGDPCGEAGVDCPALKCPVARCPDGDGVFGCTGKCFITKNPTTGDLVCAGFISEDLACGHHDVRPTPAPVYRPTPRPTRSPTRAPFGRYPTRVPTRVPTPHPTPAPVYPTRHPTRRPTPHPTPAPVYPTRPPTRRPTPHPTPAPVPPGGDSCSCQSDYDCNKPVCSFNPYTQQGTCVAGDVPPTQSPVDDPGPCCEDPHTIPTTCEVEILIDLLNLAISGEHRLAAQAVRLAFHDAGTFDVGTGEGGANGCLMTDPDFRLQPENSFLDLPLNTLETIKNAWENHVDTCVSISAADMIQFAGHVAALRQVPPLGIDAGKTATLMLFEWGRSDEPNCDINWCDNLPGFALGTDEGNIPLRCLNAGGEIKTKMMERNGFTAEESVALISAHTIGLTRNTFGSTDAAPWVDNGRDDATIDGPVFDNAFNDFLINTVTANTAAQFATDTTPFDEIFPNWFRDNVGDINHLDTDIALAFPSQNTTKHPDFHTFTDAFSNDNNLFLSTFFAAFKKMAKLGNSNLLSTPGPCDPCVGDGDISLLSVVQLVADLGEAKASADSSLLQIQKTEAFRAEREAATTALKPEEILDVETALAAFQKDEEGLN